MFGNERELWDELEKHVASSPQFYIAMGVVQIIDDMVIKESAAQ